MSSLNRVLVMGNLTRDPEIRHTPNGTAVGEIGIAINSRASDGNGGWTETVTFVGVTLWGNTAENAGKYLTKGRGVFVEGRLQLDTWDDKQSGQKRSKLKVVADNLQFLPDGKGGDRQPGSRKQPRDNGAIEPDDDDSEIPFAPLKHVLPW